MYQGEIEKLHGFLFSEATKSQSSAEGSGVPNNRKDGLSIWGSTPSWICGGLIITAFFILNSSRLQQRIIVPISQRLRFNAFKVLLIFSIIFLLFGLVWYSRSIASQRLRGA